MPKKHLWFMVGEVVIVVASYYPGSVFLEPIFFRFLGRWMDSLNVFWASMLAFLLSVLVCVGILSVLWFKLIFKTQPETGTRPNRR